MPYKVLPVLRLSETGADVVNLQDALLLLIEREELIIDDPTLRRRLLRALAKEREQQFFGDGGTLPVVKLLQNQFELPDGGEVDLPTADVINKLLEKLGALEPP